MFITFEKLKKHHASKDNLEKFESLYPAGEEIIKIFQDSRAPSQLLHWIYEHLPLNECEKDAYEKRLKIVNSSNFLQSRELTDCSFVFNSRNCSNSSRITNSNTVDGSKDVVDSKKIYFSKNIIKSKEVYNSEFVFNSESVSNSKKIVESYKVYDSECILRSKGIFTGSELYDCAYITNGFFCGECKNSSNLLFCYRLTGEEYCIFNKVVDEKVFLEVRERLEEWRPRLSLKFFKECEGFSFIEEKNAVLNKNHWHYYGIFPEGLLPFLKTLPNYDPLVLYNITLNSTVFD